MAPDQWEEELRLIGDIYDTVLHPDRWPDVLQRIGQLCGGERVALLADDPVVSRELLLYEHGHGKSSHEAFLRGGYDAVKMQVLERWFSDIETGQTSTSDKHYGGIPGFRSAEQEYVTFLHRQGIFRQAAVILDHTGSRVAAIGLNNGEAAPFTADGMATLQRLTPHLRRAFQIYRQLRSVREETASLYRMLDQMVTGVILLDISGRVAHRNVKADRLLCARSALSINKDGTLKAANPSQTINLHRLIQTTLRMSQQRSDTSTAPGGVIGLDDSVGDLSLMLTVTPLVSLAGYTDLVNDHIAAAIFISDPDAGHILSAKLLMQTYGLSKREADICQCFVNMPDLKRIAETTSLSLASVRTYLKSIYEKTGQHSQPELMRLLIGLSLDFEHIR